MWHVFTNGQDEYFKDNEYAQARKLALQWAREYGCVRLYEGHTEDENGNCVFSLGVFPT